mgnify:CR=1 FL=1
MKSRFEKLLIGLVVISLLAAGFLMIQRIDVESNHDQVEIIVDFFEVNELARQSEHSTGWWLTLFRELGATHVVLEEESIGLMRQALKPIRVEVGQDLLKEWQWELRTPSVLPDYHETVGIREYDVIIMVEDPALYQQIASGVQSRYDAGRYTLQQGSDGSVVILHGTIEDAVYSPPADLTDFEGENYFRERRLHSSQLSRLGLGFDQDKVNLIQSTGLKVLPRPFSYSDWGGETYLKGYLAEVESLNMVPDILFFGGKQLPGAADTGFSLLKSFMKDNHIKVGLVETSFQREHLDQDGLELLAEELDYHAVRIFNVWPFVQERYQFYHYEGAEEIENTLYRAVTERNIRTIYFKPFKETAAIYVTDPTEYQRIFERFETRIARHNLQLGTASVLESVHPPLWIQLLMIIGISAAGAMFTLKIFPGSVMVGWVLLAGISLPLISLMLIRPAWGEKIGALAAAIIFPSLAMWFFCSRTWSWMKSGKRLTLTESLWKGIGLMLTVSSISLMGALLVAALLSDVKYLLEMDIYRGVKISQLIPMISFGLVFMHYFGYQRNENDLEHPGIRPSEIKGILLEDIKILYVAAAGFLLAAGYVYLARTGHEGGLQPSEIEMIIRNILEESLLVRPRTKEFTVAFPALMLGAYVASLRWKSLIFLSGLAAVIGQTSIINTFSHLRTPVIVSLIRTAYSLGASIIFAAVYLLLLMTIVKVIESWGRKMWQMMEKAE